MSRPISPNSPAPASSAPTTATSTAATPTPETHVGQPNLRREDAAHLTGLARFSADIIPTGCLHAVFVRSPFPHAAITSLDASEALALPGVVAVLDASDFADYPEMPITWIFPEAANEVTPPPLLSQIVRYVGDPYALVIATDPYIAVDAAELIEVEFDQLPSVGDAIRAADPEAPQIYEHVPGNLSFDRPMVKGDPTAAAEAAEFLVEAWVRNQRLVPSPIEPRSTTVDYQPATDETTIYLSTQAPHSAKTQICQVSGIPEHQMRVIAPSVGGGFGAKLPTYREDVVLTIAAHKLGRPLTWTETRSECLLAMTNGRDLQTRLRVGFDSEAKISLLAVDTYANLGAYLSSMGQGVPGLNYAIVVGGNYDIPNIDVRVRGVLTNTTPTDTYRGAGRPEATHVSERAIEIVAKATGIVPEEVRRRNFLTDLPGPGSIGLINYDSGDYHYTQERLLDILKPDVERKRRDELRKSGRYVGVGTAAYVEFTGVGNSALQRLIGFGRGGFEQSLIRMHPDGTATLYSGLSSHGQGHQTTLAQVAADQLRLRPQDIDVRQNDTLVVPLGNGTFNSRSMPVGTGSVVEACSRLVDKAKQFAAELLNVAVDEVTLSSDGFVTTATNTENQQIQQTDQAGPTQQVSWAQVCSEAFLGGSARGIEPGLEAVAAFDPSGLACSYGMHGAVVEIDPDTGEVSIERVVAVDDCGTILNPLLATGQVHGGLAQGIGQALFEVLEHDADGNPLATSFYDYCIPRAEHFPRFETDHTVHPTPLNPLGVKGVGEAGTIGITPAIHAAVLDALEPFGVTELDMPFTPEHVWNAIDTAQKDNK